MFHHKNNEPQERDGKKKRNLSHKISIDILKPLTELVDETAFRENLNELYQHLGVNHLDPTSQTYKDLRAYLTQVLQYPNKSLAKLHRQSHRLGAFDKLTHNATDNPNDKFQQATLIDQMDNCPCCGLRKQIDELKVCSTSFNDLKIIGISTYMFFRTMRNLIYFLILALIVFGAFAFASNIKCSNLWNDNNTDNKLQHFKNTIMISLGSKIYLALNGGYNDLLIWQVWLGLVMVVLFIVGYIWMERVEVTQIVEVDYETKSASDYSVVVKGVPAGVTKQDIQSAIDSIFSDQQTPHKIIKINCGTPININSEVTNEHKNQLIELEQKSNQYRQAIFSWLIELSQHGEFITSLPQRQRIITEFHENIKQYQSKQQQIVAKIMKLYQQDKIDTITDCFVTFESRQAKQHLLDSISYTAFDKFLRFLTMNVYKKTIRLQLGLQGEKQQYKCKIQQASQPEDIIWQSIGTFLSIQQHQACAQQIQQSANAQHIYSH